MSFKLAALCLSAALLLTLPFVSLSRDARLHWILVSYHKTGYDLTRKFVIPFEYYCNFKTLRITGGENVVISSMNKILQSPITVVHGQNMLFPWDEVLGNISHHQFKVIQFIRDPFDMVISGYLYHWQKPMLEKVFNPQCNDLTQPVIFKYAERLNGCPLQNSIVGNVSQAIIVLQEECQQLRAEYGLAKVTFHVDALRGIAQQHKQLYHYDAVRWEAVRAACFDLLKMGANVAASIESGADMVLSFVMDDFPLSNSQQTYKALQRLESFLLNHTTNVRNPFYLPLQRRWGIAKEVHSAWLDPRYSHRSGHVTNTAQVAPLRQEWKQQLHDDPALSVILSAVQNLVNYARYNGTNQYLLNDLYSSVGQ